MMLRSFRFPGQGLLVWSNAEWLKFILPSDSQKKKLFHVFASLPGFACFLRHFDGKLPFDGRMYDLDDLLAQFSDIVPFPTVSAIFVNGRRDPQRIYVWLESEGNPMFLKIGKAAERPVFENEADALTGLHTNDDIIVMRPRALRLSKTQVLLLSNGLSQSMHQQKQRLSPDKVLSYFVRQGLQASGFFGGPIHGDLASNNVFQVGNRLLIVDWEFAVPDGPDYCDLIELCAALVIANRTQPPSLADLQAQVRRSTDLELDDSTLNKALEFLAQRGNINARIVLTGMKISN